MTKTGWLAAALMALCGQAHAQATASQGGNADQQGMLSFDPAFFAASQPTSALDMVQRLPGFSIEFGDNVRGLAGTAANVLIDGRRPNSKSEAIDTVLRRIPADGVQRLELIRGGAPGIDMQGRSVVANVILKRSAVVSRQIELNTTVYPDGYVAPRLAGQFSRREGDRLLEASFTTRMDRTDATGKGFRRRYDAAGKLIQDADLDLRDGYRNARGTVGWQGQVAGGKLKLNGLLGWSSSKREQDLLILSGPGADGANTERVELTRLELGGTWTRDLSPKLEAEIVGLHTALTQDYAGATSEAGDSTLFRLDERSRESVAKGVLRYRPAKAWALEAGAETAYNVLDSATRFEENGAPVALPSAKVKVSEVRGEVFGQATWRPSSKFTLESAVRVEVSKISQSGDTDLAKSFVYPKPRLQATWTPWVGHQFRVRLEREVGQLDFGDFVASADIDVGQVEAGNPDLEPARSTIIEGVYEWRFWGKGVAEVTVRHAKIKDVVDIIPLAGGFDGVGNIGDGRSDRLQVRVTLPTDKLGLANARVQLNGDWSHTEVTDPVTGRIRRVQGDQAFSCSVSFVHDLSGGRLSYGFDHGCSPERGATFRVQEVRRTVSRPYITAFGQWKPSSATVLRLELLNVTNYTFGYDREIHAGPRDSAPLQYTEMRRAKASPSLLLQVRRSF